MEEPKRSNIMLAEATMDELLYELQNRCNVSLVCVDRQDVEEQVGYFFHGHYLTLLGFAEKCRVEILRQIEEWEKGNRGGSHES